MVGKILLVILGVILLVLLMALLLPGYIRVSYESGEVHVAIRYAWWSFAIYPFQKTEKKEQVKDKKPEKKKKQREIQKPNREQIFYSLDMLPRILTKAASHSLRKLRISPLKVHVLVAGSDPADTAVLYGRIQAVLGAMLPQMHRAVRIKDQDIQLFPDFTQERMDFIVDVGIGMRILDLTIIGISPLAGILKWYRGYKQRADKQPDPKQHKNGKVTAGADNAA